MPKIAEKIMVKCLCGEDSYARGLCHAHYIVFTKKFKRKSPEIETALYDRMRDEKQRVRQGLPPKEYPELSKAFNVNLPKNLNKIYHDLLLGKDEWFDKNHAKELTDKFCEWWFEEGCIGLIDQEQFHRVEGEVKRQYFLYLAYALKGWRAGRYRLMMKL